MKTPLGCTDYIQRSLNKIKRYFSESKQKVFLPPSKCMICHSINALADFLFEMPKSTS